MTRMEYEHEIQLDEMRRKKRNLKVKTAKHNNFNFQRECGESLMTNFSSKHHCQKATSIASYRTAKHSI